MMTRLKTVIVDDEPLARENLAILLRQDAEIDISAHCANGYEALDAIQQLRPDLVFLDIQMPSMCGFEVVTKMEMNPPPDIIFVTAFDQYALDAFQAHALDYLLKPFDDERFRQALERAKQRVRERKSHGEITKLLHALRQNPSPLENKDYPSRLSIHEPGRITFLDLDTLIYVSAAGNYLELHTDQKVHLMRETMANLETKLNPEHFVRIHRSTIVCIKSITELRPHQRGESIVVLRDGTELKVSRGYRNRLQPLLDSA